MHVSLNAIAYQISPVSHLQYIKYVPIDQKEKVAVTSWQYGWNIGRPYILQR